MRRYLMGVDCGADGVRAALFDECGNEAAAAACAIAPEEPDGGTGAVLAAMARAVEDCGAQATRVAAVGFTGCADGTFGALADEASGTLKPEAAARAGLRCGTAAVLTRDRTSARAAGAGAAGPGSGLVGLWGDAVVCIALRTPAADGGEEPFLRAAAVPGVGRSLPWLLGSFYHGERDYGRIEREAAEIPPGANRLLYVPDHAGAGDGMLFGLSASHTRANVARAVLEGMAFAVRDAAETLRQAGAEPAGFAVCGELAGSPLWRRILCDVLNVPTYLPERYAEPAALGAALTAGVRAGVYPDLSAACAAAVRATGRLEPDADASERCAAYYSFYRRLAAARDSLMTKNR